MTGEERDRLEHEEALKPWGGRMPLGPYANINERRPGNEHTEGRDLKQLSRKWDELLEEAFSAQKQGGPEKHDAAGVQSGETECERGGD